MMTLVISTWLKVPLGVLPFSSKSRHRFFKAVYLMARSADITSHSLRT